MQISTDGKQKDNPTVIDAYLSRLDAAIEKYSTELHSLAGKWQDDDYQDALRSLESFKQEFAELEKLGYKLSFALQEKQAILEKLNAIHLR